MVDEDRATRVRRVMAELAPRGKTTRIPAAVRSEIVRYASARRAAGVSWRAIATAIAVSKESIRRWTVAIRRARRPTRVLPDALVVRVPPRSAPAPRFSRNRTVASP